MQRPAATLSTVMISDTTEPLRDNDRFIAEIHGVPCYQEGKVTRLNTWLESRPDISLKNSWFYSDSHNDQPLLEQVTNPVAVDPDEELRQVAILRNWDIVSFRDN